MFKLTISCVLLACVAAFPEEPPSYRPGIRTGPSSPELPPSSYNSPSEPTTPKSCEEGLILDPLGECVQPEVIRDLYVFQEPTDAPSTDVPELPQPKVKLNLLVIKTNEEEEPEPIIIPPPQEKTLVLVLSKKGSNQRQIIEVPAPEGQKPEVFFVDYAEGENPILPGNIYLQDALNYAESPPSGGQPDGGNTYTGSDDAVDTDLPDDSEPYSPYYF